MSVRRVSRYNSSCYRAYTPSVITSAHPAMKRPRPSRPYKRFFSPATHHLAWRQKIADTGAGTVPTTSLVGIVAAGGLIAVFYLPRISILRLVLRGGR